MDYQLPDGESLSLLLLHDGQPQSWLVLKCRSLRDATPTVGLRSHPASSVSLS